VTTADGPDGLARIVRQEIKDGAEIVKIFLTGGHATGGSGEDWLMSETEFAAALQAAHQRGAKTRAHLASKAAILMSIRHHIHIVDHGDGMDAECIEKLAQTGTFLTPSLLFPKEMMQAMAGHPFAEAMREPWAQMAQILPRASAAGVKLLIGDDYGAFTLTHGRYGEEMTLYVEECGVPALDVIRWATRNGAEAMGLGDQTGTIEAGKLADLLVVDGDPSIRIALLQDRANLLAIIKGGRLVKDQLGREQMP
jgi:imidazolonepropionase-like amidohydrolase